MAKYNRVTVKQKIEMKKYKAAGYRAKEIAVFMNLPYGTVYYYARQYPRGVKECDDIETKDVDVDVDEEKPRSYYKEIAQKYIKKRFKKYKETSRTYNDILTDKRAKVVKISSNYLIYVISTKRNYCEYGEFTMRKRYEY